MNRYLYKQKGFRRLRPALCLVLLLTLIFSCVAPGAAAVAADLPVTTALTASCKDAEGQTFRVTATYGADAGIPGDAALKVAPIAYDDADYDDYAQKAVEAVGCSEGTATKTRLFDISLVSSSDRNKEYQPADGASVAVYVRMGEAVENELCVVHFGDEPEVVPSGVSAAGKTVSFEATGFSVYAFVDVIGGDSPVADETAFDQAPLYLSVTSDKHNTYYVGKDIIENGTRLKKTAANSTEGAVPYSFEKLPGTDNVYYMYRYENGEKIYLKLTLNTKVQFVTNSSNATAFTVIPCGPSFPNCYWLQFPQGDVMYYFNMRGSDNGKGFGGSTYGPETNDRGSMVTAVRNLFTEDQIQLDSRSYALAIPFGNNTAAILTAEAQDGSTIAARSCAVRANPLQTDNDVIIDAGHDTVVYTFHAIDAMNYRITTEFGGSLKYLNLKNGSLTLVDEPDEYSLFQISLGTGAQAGKIRIVSSQAKKSAISLKNNTVEQGFTGREVSDESTFFKLLTPTVLGDDDFVPYTAIKVSVSDTAKVHNGSQVVVYTRIWNDKAKQYEFYAINHDGSLVRCYDEGDTIRWAGTQVNTMLWDFTEYYYWLTRIPNYYYELRNTYSGKYLAPQYHSGQILSDHTIGINLNGRRYGDHYTTILAWDDYRYDYAGLRTNADNTSAEAVPMTKAQDFYFAIMDDPTPEEFSTVPTVDNNEHGIKMRMINFRGQVSGNNRNVLQTTVIGADTTTFTSQVPTTNLVSTDFNENGYPVATHTNRSLEELFGGATPVNHLFLKSIYNESGYFEYDCTQTFATLKDDGDFRIYNQIGSVMVNTPSQGHGWFLPYNDISPDVINSYTNVTDVHNQPLPTNDPRLGETLYGVPLNSAQYFFGMEMEASFIQSKDGLDAWGHDIIFEFAGDDDMWLYVDGELVLDLGGIHSALVGKINFRTGIVELPDMSTDGRTQKTTTLRALFEQNYRSRNPQATDAEVQTYLDRFFADGGTVFKDYTSHTMKMYYMERGAGASNLHMRFNLTTATDGQLLLKKTVSGTDKQDYASMKFPYQIWYFDKTAAQWRRVSRTTETVEGKTVYEYTGVTFINYESTKVPVEYEANYYGYPDVFFLKPGETAEIQFPDDSMEYKLIECRVDTSIYDEVLANDTQLIGIAGETGFADYATEPEVIGERKVVNFTNHVDEDALRTLQIKKRLYDVNGNELTYEEDDTGFRFRLYIGEGDDSEGLGYYRMDSYYVKNPDGYYCRYDYDTQKFSPLTKKDFDSLTEEELDACTFTTSPSGAIDKIPTEFTVEIRNLLIDTQFMVEEREADIPKGYNFIRYVREDGSYIVDDGDAINRGTIRARQNPTVIVENHRGWGLTMEKVWTDDAFMSSHDNIYFAVFCGGEMVDGTLRRLNTEVTENNPVAESSYYYYFETLQAGTVFSDYTIAEVQLDDPVVNEDGFVTGYSGLRVIADGGTISNGGVPAETGKHAQFSYRVNYTVGTPTGPADNVRTDTIENNRPGLKIMKVDGAGRPLPGAVFTIKDGEGNNLNAETYTSDETGLVTFAYLENNHSYTLTEISTPDGYSALFHAMTLYSDNGELVVSCENEDAYAVQLFPEDGSAVLTLKNYETHFTAIKVDSGNNAPMSDVHFALYRQVAGKNGLIRDYYPLAGYADLVTGADGLIPKLDDTLPVGVYYLAETQTPVGYYAMDHDILIEKDKSGNVAVLSAGDEDLLTKTLNADHTVTFTLQIPNRRTMKTIELTPQTLVADYGLKIRYNATVNNFYVPENSHYEYVGVTDLKNEDLIGTYEAPELLAGVGQPLAGKFGTLTLSANGDTDYTITSTSFTGEDAFCLVAHVDRIRGEAADVYVYERHTYIPATTVYYEDDFGEADSLSAIDRNRYIDGEDRQSSYNFGTWSKVSSGQRAEYQSADLAGVTDANVFGYDPAYIECSVYSNQTAHKVSVADVNAPNKGGKWPQVVFDFAGTGFDVVSVTACDTGVFTARVYKTEVDEQGNVSVGNQAAMKMIDTYYGYRYGKLYLTEDGAPTLENTGRKLYEATQEIIDSRSPENLLTVSGKFVTPTETYLAPDGSKSGTPYYYDAKGNVTADEYYIDTQTQSVVPASSVGRDASGYTPNYAYAEASGWVLDNSAEDSLYQIPVIKFSGLTYGTYRAVIEPRFTANYGHFETVDSYKYFDLYVDAFRVYDPAGSGEDGTLTSKVISEAYAASNEAHEWFTTLKSVIVGAETMGSNADQAGAVLVDGGELLETDRMSDYIAFGPMNELYLGKGMSVAFEITAGTVPTDVQLQMKKISTADPSLQILYYEKNGTLFKKAVPIHTATDQSYSLFRMIGSDNIKWTKRSDGGVTSGLVVVSNVGEENSIISITNLKWTFANAGEGAGVSRQTAKPTLSGTNPSGVKKAIALSRKNISILPSAEAPASYEDGKVTITVNTGADVESLVITDLHGDAIEESLLKSSFVNVDDEQRQWTVTVDEDEDGTHNYLIRPAGEGFVSGERLRVVVTVDNPMQEDPQPAQQTTEPPVSDDVPEEPGNAEEPAADTERDSFFEYVRDLILSFIELLRKLLSYLGIAVQ